MANRYMHPQQGALQSLLVLVVGRFRPNGTSAVDNTLNKGEGFTVARTAAGDFTITLTDTYTALISANVAVHAAADTDLTVTLGAETVATDGKVKLTVLTATTPTDMASDADSWISFQLFLKNTSVAN